jgi:lipopolysaccharide export system protein LptC
MVVANGKHKRTAHRWQLMLWILAGLLMAFGSWWLVLVMERGDGVPGLGAAPDEPDYIVEKFSFVRMSPDGRPRYLFSGDKLTHRPANDISIVERPVVQGVGQERRPTKIVAEHARISPTDSRIDMFGGVRVDQPATAQLARREMRTERLTVFPDEERMETTAEVQMMDGRMQMRSQGLRYDHAKMQLQAKRAHVLLPPGQEH